MIKAELTKPQWHQRCVQREPIGQVQDDPTDARRPVSYYVTILTLMLAAVLGVVVAKVKTEVAV
jgi:hypothetical protein